MLIALMCCMIYFNTATYFMAMSEATEFKLLDLGHLLKLTVF